MNREGVNNHNKYMPHRCKYSMKNPEEIVMTLSDVKEVMSKRAHNKSRDTDEKN